MIRIISAGMYRSGTTWQLNALRLCWEHAGYSVYCAPYDPDYYDPDHGCQVEVLMTRKGDHALAESAHGIVSTWRNPADIRASMERRAAYLREHPDSRFTNEADVERFDVFQERARWWQLRAEYIQMFDLIRTDPEVLVGNYLNLYGLDADPQQILASLATEMVPPTDGIDTRTWLHAGHITLEPKSE